MSTPQDREVRWVRFPKGEAKLCMMTLEGNRPGLLLLHENSDRGRAVLERAQALGFRAARMRSGGMAAVFMRGEGYPFRVSELAEKLGGKAVPVKESVLRAEAFPRPPAPPRAGAPVAETPAPAAPQPRPADLAPVSETQEAPAIPRADDSVAEEILALIAAARLAPDEPAETDHASPDFA